MATYRTGTVAVAAGSKTVTGTGTLWAVTVSPGDEFCVCDANALPTGGRYEVGAVNSNTSITLVQNYQGSTASGLAYAVMNMAGNQSVPQFSNRLSQFFDKQQTTLNAPGVNVIKVGGTTFSPDAVARQLEFIAGAGVTLTPSATGKTVTVAGTAATVTASGVIELATTAEATAGTDTARAVTPATSGSRVEFAVTSTDDATSATAAPLKSAGGLAVAKNIIVGGTSAVLPGGTSLKLAGTITSIGGYVDHDISLVAPAGANFNSLLRMAVSQTNTTAVIKKWVAYVEMVGASTITVGNEMASSVIGGSSTVLSFSRPTQTTLRVTLTNIGYVQYSITLTKEA